MRDLVIYHGAQTIEELNKAKAMPLHMQRFMFFTQKINREFTVYKSYWTDDNRFVFVVDKYKVRLSSKGNLFTTSTYVHGLTYEPDNKHKLTLWRNTKLNDVWNEVLDTMLVSAGAEWAVNPKLKRMLHNKGLFTRVLKGRITNSVGLEQAYLRVSPLVRDLKLSHRATSLAMLSKRGYDMWNVYDFLSIVKDPESCIDKMLSGAKPERRETYNQETHQWEGHGDFGYFELQDYIQMDIRRELKILDKKIDHKWSSSRLMEEHTDMTREVMELELKLMKPVDYSYHSECPVMPGMELITNNRRLFSEGTIMRHCIYSYLDKAVDRKLFHFHVMIGERPFSLAIEEKDGGVYGVQQMFRKRNASCSDTQRMLIDGWLSESSVQEWFKVESKIPAIQPEVEEVDNLPF